MWNYVRYCAGFQFSDEFNVYKNMFIFSVDLYVHINLAKQDTNYRIYGKRKKEKENKFHCYKLQYNLYIHRYYEMCLIDMLISDHCTVEKGSVMVLKN